MGFILVSLLFGLALAAAIGTIAATIIPNYRRIRSILAMETQPQPLPVHIRRERRHGSPDNGQRVTARPRAAA